MGIEQICGNYRELPGEVLGLLSDLVACDTTDYHENNGQAVLRNFFEGLDCKVIEAAPDANKLSRKYAEFNAGHTYENRNCLMAEFEGSGGGRSLIINAHMDTVLPASIDEWETDPFSAVFKDDRAFGLGTCDTKGGMCAALIALKRLHQKGIALNGTVIFQSVVDEEAGGGNGSLACIDTGQRADAVLVIEPTELVPACAHIGSYAMKLTVSGKSAHSNMKESGVSAFEKSLPIIDALKELEGKWRQRKHVVLPSPFITVVQATCGDGSMTIPAKCELLVNYTYLPDGYDYYDEIMRVIGGIETNDDWFKKHPIVIEKHHDVKPYYLSTEARWVSTARECVSRILGKKVSPMGLGCGSDARLYANIGGMDTIVLGPGSIDQAHKPNEYVEIEQLIKAVKVYTSLMCEWCGIKNSN